MNDSDRTESSQVIGKKRMAHKGSKEVLKIASTRQFLSVFLDHYSTPVSIINICCNCKIKS